MNQAISFDDSRRTPIKNNTLFIALGFMCIAASFGVARSDAPDTETLPGTHRLDWNAPLDVSMMRTAHSFVERKITQAQSEKNTLWHPDFASEATYNQSIQPNRDRLRFLLGVGKQSQPSSTHVAFEPSVITIRMERIGDDQVPATLYENDSFRVMRVRWPVLDGVFGEGLLLEPKKQFTASVVVVPDADQHPEQLVGLMPGVPAANQIARRLAISGVRVIVPTLVNRQDVTVDGRLGQSNREWIYRQAFHMGRHIIGYEIDKIEAAIDWLEKTNINDRSIGIAGWGEGALLALYTAALDTRLDAAILSGDWARREASWREPIYRNIWSIMKEFDDADIATMIAPRKVFFEPNAFPLINQKRDKAMLLDEQVANDTSATVLSAGTRLDQRRGLSADEQSPWNTWFHVLPAADDKQSPYDESAQATFANALQSKLSVTRDAAMDSGAIDYEPFVAERQRRQIAELDEYTQRLVRDSEFVRDNFYLNQALPVLAQRKWSTEAVHETTPVEDFTQHSTRYRNVFANEILGTFDDSLLPPNPRSRLIRQTDQWVAHDVVLDVVPDLFAWGILMQPRNLKAGEARPVVVVQHGRNGLPENILNGGYNGIAQKLLERGYIVFAPHNLYRGEDEYRWLDRKANAIGKTLFSVLLLQHDQITRWLATLPQVDGDRIAFYGNSYGGESAVRIPTVLTKYALSICASDFNDWTRKVTDTHDRHSFMGTVEWEMPYFNMGQTFSYAEMAYLMIPRPFMVERGHHDLVAPDHWVASEYAKVRLVYDQLGIGDRTAITFFQGGHTMRGEATLQFLEKHLGMPTQ